MVLTVIFILGNKNSNYFTNPFIATGAQLKATSNLS